MTQSSLQKSPPGLHVAIIMDGNGRWAKRRSRQRLDGHRVGAKAVRAVTRAAPSLGIGTLTLYAFSQDNWKRPPREVRGLMHLFAQHLREESETCRENGVRLNVIGRRDRLRPELQTLIPWAERYTAHGKRLHLRIAIDYSARDAILRAQALLAQRSPPVSPAEFSAALNRAMHSRPAAPDVDLLIRTSGEQRLSDYLLWECAYAELYFCQTPWPKFGKRDLAAAIAEYRRRDRRFGATEPLTQDVADAS